MSLQCDLLVEKVNAKSSMPSSKTSVKSKPASAIQRRKVGEVWWKSVLNQLIDSEKEDLEDLRILRRKLSDTESLRIVAALFDRKAERVIELTLLLRYRDKEKEASNGHE